MGSLLSCLSEIMYMSEKVTLYLTCIGLICCLILTITVTLGMGVGLGYNYCFVNLKTRFKYIKSHYIYPGSPRWPYKRGRQAVDEPLFDETAEDEELRRPPELPEITTAADDIDRRILREYLRYNNTGSGIAMDYHPTFPDSETFNGTESSVKTTVDSPTNVEVTEIGKNSPKTNNRSNITASATEDKTEIIYETDEPTPEPSSVSDEDKTEIIYETDEPTPDPSIVNKEHPKSSPSSRKVKKLVIPISGLDLISLLSKLKAENKNYSLQIVTT